MARLPSRHFTGALSRFQSVTTLFSSARFLPGAAGRRNIEHIQRVVYVLVAAAHLGAIVACPAGDAVTPPPWRAGALL